MKKLRSPNRLYAFMTAAIFALLFTGCLNDGSVAPVNERLDIIFEGDLEEQFFVQSLQEDQSVDLVRYDIRDQNHSIDFILTLDAQRKLVFKLTDEARPYSWELDDNGFSLYAQEDQEDKLKYVTAELLIGGEGQAFTSNSGSDFPRGTQVNAFRIVDFDPTDQSVLCRIQDFPMVANSNADKTMVINGTFRASLADLN